MMIPALRPFPTSSSMYRHTKFIISTNMTMKEREDHGAQVGFQDEFMNGLHAGVSVFLRQR